MHRVSLSFLVDTMDKRRGGCAPNIAYTLALLGERPALMATAGQDFGDYRAWLDAAGIDTSLVKVVDDKFTASFFCSTDQANNQIASFYTGAMANAGELSFRTVPGLADDGLVIISPNDPEAMVQYAQECSTMGIRYIWDPGQQCARMDGTQLAEGVTGAFMVIVNDYEFELLRQKTGLSRGGRPAAGAGPGDHARRERLPVLSQGTQRRRPGGRAASHRGSDGRRRCVPRRLHEGAGHRRARTKSAPGSEASPRPTRSSTWAERATRTSVDGVRGPVREALRAAHAVTLSALGYPLSSADSRKPKLTAA